MKKAVLFAVLAMVVVGFCAAQSANVERGIIGTWVDNNGTTWVFNTNGNLSFGTTALKFGVAGTQLAIIENGYVATYEVNISSNGNTLILIRRTDDTNHFDADDAYFLSKK